VFALGGYGLGNMPPKRCSRSLSNCSSGNSIVEPYTAVHHFLLTQFSGFVVQEKLPGILLIAVHSFKGLKTCDKCKKKFVSFIEGNLV